MANQYPPPGGPYADPAIQRELQALRRWRDIAVQQRRVALGAIKDTDLNRIVMSGRKDVRQVRAMLPISVRHLAEEMIDVQIQVNQPAPEQGGPPGNPGPVYGPVSRPGPDAPGRVPGAAVPPQGQPYPPSGWGTPPPPPQQPATGPSHRSGPPPQTPPARPRATAPPAPGAGAPTDRGGQARPSGGGSGGPPPTEARPGGAPPTEARPGSAPPSGAAPGGAPPTGAGASPAASTPGDPRHRATGSPPPPSGPPAPPAQPVAPAEPDPHDLRSDLPRIAPTRRIVQPGQAPVKVTELRSGLRLRWPADPEAGPFAAYRVVSADERPPHSPESGQLVALTSALTAVDTRPPTAARRFFRVFSYTGETREEMWNSDPRLIAGADLVFSLQQPTLEEDEGRVIGRWPQVPGVERVHVFRIPVERAHMVAPADEQYRINAEDRNLTGFVDKTAVRGRRYRYDFYVEAEVNGVARLSDVTSVECSVSAVLTPVTDLRVVKHVGEDQTISYDLSWTRPAAGDVAIYRTETGPAAGATNQAHAVDALPLANLKPENRLQLPVEPLEDGREGMRDVPAKQGWTRIHLTPVTVLDGQARVGQTVTQLVVGRPLLPEIVERCHHQILKFGWPSGAAKVAVLPRRRGEPAELPVPGPGYAEIDKDTYDRLGGLQFRAPLPAQGCAVHLAGVAFEGGDGDFGPPAAVDYPGLVRLYYALDPRNRFFKLDRLVVRLWAEQELVPAPAFALVHRTDRLPLFLQDGNPLEVTLEVDDGGQASRLLRPDRIGREPSAIGWSAPVRGLSGYVRLFVDGSAGQFALLDPAASSLLLPPP